MAHDDLAIAAEATAGSAQRTRVADTRQYPYRAIARLRITDADGKLILGTGFFIGPRTVITAAHCLFVRDNPNPARNGPVRSVEVIPGLDDDHGNEFRPFGSSTSTDLRPHSLWVDQGLSMKDYGAIILKPAEPLGNTVGTFGFGVYPNDVLRNVTANVSGYPGPLEIRPGETAHTQLFHSVPVDNAEMPARVSYRADTSRGHSGAPVWRIIEHRRFAFAIHTIGVATIKVGIRINEDVFADLTAWKNV